MALKDIQIPKVDVVVAAGSSFAVRGLSPVDIEALARRHGEDLRQLFNEFVNGDIDWTKVELGVIAKQLFGRAPEIILDIIGTCADADDEDRVVLQRLPAGAQVKALVAIFGLTLSVEGDLGNALQAVIKMLGGANTGLAVLLQGLASQ